jgi:hypothetical protein
VILASTRVLPGPRARKRQHANHSPNRDLQVSRAGRAARSAVLPPTRRARLAATLTCSYYLLPPITESAPEHMSVAGDMPLLSRLLSASSSTARNRLQVTHKLTRCR